MKFIQHSTMRRVFVFLIVLFNLFYRTESQNSSALTTPSLVPRIPFPPTTRFESANLSSTDIITHLQVSTDALSGPAITRVPTTSTDALPTGPAITRVPTTSTDHALPTGPAITRVRPTTSTDALPRTAIVRFPTPSAASRSTPSSTSLPKNNNTKGSIRTEVPANSPCWTFYNESYLPQGNMEIAHFQMHQLYPLVYTYCSASLLPLMCSVYVPKFDPATETNLQPCADLCDQVANDCHYAASKLNFRITTLLNRCRVDNAQCFRPNISSPRNPLNRSCCFEVKPQPFCNIGIQRTVLNDTMQDKVIFKLSTYLPLFHALDSLNLSHCASQLSIYLCMKNFEFQFCRSGLGDREECSGNIVMTSRQTCLYFVNTSSPCSLSGINTTLQNAGYNIPVSLTDFDCSTLPIEPNTGQDGRGVLLISLERLIGLARVLLIPNITNGHNIPRLSNVAVSKPNSNSLNVNWKMNGERDKIEEYGILWRKRAENEAPAYQHIHTKVENHVFTNIDPNVQYEVLVTAIAPNWVPEPFTLVVSPEVSFNEFCESEKVGTPEAFGIFVWPETPVGNRSTLPCPYNPESFASRECLYANPTESGNVWGPIDVTKCKYNDVRSKDLFLLAQKEVNNSNVVETSQEVKNLSSVNPPQTLQPGDISNIATVLAKIVSVPQKANEISDDFFTTVDNVLDSRIENVLASQQNANSSSRIVEALNNLLEALVIGPRNKFVKVNRNYAINLQVVQPQTFTGLSFSGIVRKSHESSLKKNSISAKDDDSVPTAANSAASISVPRTVFNESTITNRSIQQTAIFVLYKETKFFRVFFVDSSETANRLNSFVIAGSIKGLSVANLSEPVKIVLQRIVPGDTNSTLCSYWDFNLGNWSQEGCRFERVLGDGRILCNCNHLTNFAMLMDINPEPTKHDRILGVISYVGCALSLAGLILTIITILILRDLRNKIPSQILLNFCIALSLSLIVFLAAAERSKTSSLAGCRTAAIALHYFLLATFLWMAIEAFNMYLAFVKVFPNSSPSKFMLKCCLIAWGLPVIIVAITMIAALDKYGDDTYCRLHGVPFIVACFTPVTLIIVGNIVAFCLIIRSLITSGTKVTSVRKASGHQQARQGIAIMVLLGLTWIFGILAINDAKLAFQYLFCIFNSLQGFVVFIMFCVLPDGTRRQLQTLIRKKTIDALRREDKHRNLEAGNASLNNLVYSSNVSPVVTSELQFRSLSSGDQVTETSFQSGDGFRIENDDLQKEISDLKFPDTMFSNPNVTRYSVRKNGSNYITTIELNLKGDF